MAAQTPSNGMTPKVNRDDEQGFVGFFHTIERLKTNKRTGWVNKGIRLPESIADHMYRMAMMALVMPETASGHRLDIARCVMMSIVHDMAEADTGDIPPEHASGVSKHDKHDLEVAAMNRMFGLLGHPSISSLRIKALWQEYEARQTPEAKFVKDLDMFELAVQGVEYENTNDVQTLQGFFETTVPRILHPTVKQWARELMEQRKQNWIKRGWQGYQHVDVSDKTDSCWLEPLAESTNGESALPAGATRLPVRIYGTHDDETTEGHE
ncbi:hypothetical protein OIO90_000804 [Microbotryomycetes sp. JL221]|nr:hypothetical protein OIO90_000804 [Microbotryomycetes sp. JL221]